MRIFIGIKTEAWLRTKLSGIQNDIRKITERGSFTRTENFHLTLCFIGEYSQDKIGCIEKIIDGFAKKTTCFSIKGSQLGVFPKGNKGIVYFDLEQSQHLSNAYRKLVRELYALGIIDQNRLKASFKPHITMARNVPVNQEIIQKLSVYNCPELVLEVKGISVFESLRENEQLVYKEIYFKELNI